MAYILKYHSNDNRVLKVFAVVNSVVVIHAKRERRNTLLSTAMYNLNCHVIKLLDNKPNTREKKL
jgi:hypothetical protein